MKQKIIEKEITKKYRLFILLTALLVVVVPTLANSLDRPNKPEANVTPRSPLARSRIAPQLTSQPNYIKGEVLVKFKTGKINLNKQSDEKKLSSFNWVNNVQESARLAPQNIARLTSKTKTTAMLIRSLKYDPDVEYVEPNYLYTATVTTPNDSSFGSLWGLNNTGQTVNGTAGTADDDIDAPEAWDLSTGSTAVTVAVIDSGIAINHPDLAGNLVAGYDFVSSDSTPEDLNDHGTHVAGTISAVGNNGIGVTGVSWNTKIMPLRALGADGSGTTANIAAAVTYAAANGAHIINMSLGGTGYSQTFYDAINTARTAGVLVVVAAGNNGTNNDGGTHRYPCDYDLDNIICVAATDQDDLLASFSNYGTTSVDVAAPGVNIYSTMPYHAFTENFNGATTPGFTGTQFTSSGTNNYWLTNGSGDIAAYGGTPTVYEHNSNGILTSSSTDTSSYDVVWLQYDYAVESQDTGSCLSDYLLIQIYNGSVWTEVKRYCGTGTSGTETIDVSAYKNATMRVRYQWVTDGSGSSCTGPYYPDCLGAGVDNVRFIPPNSATADYQFLQGTSMATPQVAGLAALLKSYKPSITYLGLRNAILNNVDAKGLPIVTGGRINAFTSLSSVDIIAPTATVSYSTIAATNQNVTATLVPNETIVVTNNSGSASYTFTANGSFDFTFTDVAGNPGATTTATVTNIDKTAPVITVAPYVTTPTNADITVTATTDEGTLNAASNTFTANGSFDFVATDAVGNATTSAVTISNIDKTAPVITIAPYTTTPTNQDVVVTATTDEGTLNAASHTFTANGSFDFVATDAAGNATISTVTITNIDKSPPKIKTILLTKGVYSYKLNGKATKIQPFGTDYKGAIWARSVDFGPDGVIFIFINSSAYKKGQIKVFRVNGKLLKAYNPYGGFATSGLNATIMVESNKKVYLAVGTLKAGTAVKTYEITAKKFTALNSLTAATKAGNVQVSFKKLYKTQYGLVTMKQGDKKTLKVWKLDLTKNKFVEDKKINKTKLKI